MVSSLLLCVAERKQDEILEESSVIWYVSTGKKQSLMEDGRIVLLLASGTPVDKQHRKIDRSPRSG
jgi:hypothetical protein